MTQQLTTELRETEFRAPNLIFSLASLGQKVTKSFALLHLFEEYSVFAS